MWAIVPTLRSLAIAAVLVGLASIAHGEHGSPGVVDPFDDGDEVPTNALVPLLGTNGVPFGLADLEELEPRLVNGSRSIPLRIVESFDDLEGHAQPFPDDGGGYGENLILLAPRFRLAPSTRYAFTLGTGSAQTVYFDVSTGNAPDAKGPEWRSAPFLDLAAPKADEPLLPADIITALDESPELPLYFIVDLAPREPHARPKRMMVTLHLPSTADRNCGSASVWDHAQGVYADDTDSDLGRRYVATLTAIDAAGNRRRAPGSGVPIVWSGSLAVCNRPGGPPAAAVTPAPPRWLAKPSHSAVTNPDFSPSADHGTAYDHALRLPVETTTVAVVELTLRRQKAPFTSYRRVGLLWPSKQAPSGQTSPRRDQENCVEPLITNADREKVMPSNDEPVSVQVAIIDALGRRLEHNGAPLTLSNLHPSRSRIEVCATADAKR